MIFKHNKQFANRNAVSSFEIDNLIGLANFRTKKDLKQTVVRQMEQLLFNFESIIDVENYYENLTPKYLDVEKTGDNKYKIKF